MRCMECGREISDNQSFCQYCGNPVDKNSVLKENAVQMMKCKNCGKILESGNAFCTNCGTPISTTNMIGSASQDNTETKDNKIGKILIAVIVVLVSAFASYFVSFFIDYYGKFNQRSEQLRESEITEDNKEEIEAEETVAGKTAEDEAIEDESTEEEELSAVADSDAFDVESTVLEIGDRYDEIVKGISFNTYDVTPIDVEVVAYSEQNEIRVIVTKKAYEEYGYTRTYYYDRGKLFFADYEGVDSHRFYFAEDKLIRWRYFPDAADSSKAVNSDLETTPEYYRWENNVLAESQKLVASWENALANGSSMEEYILAGSDSRYIQKSELQGLTAEECRLARNEIYARHGRRFDDEYLQAYFGSKEWYTPTMDPDEFEESLLNSYEIANRDLIVEYEEECGYR